MIPVIALVGRPNVGKSTLFNRLTNSRQALVLNEPGVTRDRQFGQGKLGDKPYIVIDTGGIIDHPLEEIDKATLKQSHQAISEASILFFVVDTKDGLTPFDLQLAKALRKHNKTIILVMNKLDGAPTDMAKMEFSPLGFTHMFATTASQNWGIESLVTHALSQVECDDETPIESLENNPLPKVAIIGRPNVGKSTLVNRMLGEERVIVCDYPGTTRDSIYISMERMGKQYTLIDTAGVRRKRSVHEVVEKFSVVKTLQAIKDANVVILAFDAREGLTDQDLSLIDFTIEAGSGLIICANKWDGMASEDKDYVKKQLAQRLRFADFVPIHYISALHGTGVGDLFKIINRVYQCATIELSTTQVTDILNRALEAHQPPLVHGRRIKLRYAHCGGHNPPTIIIHGNQTEDLPQSYQRFLAKYYMKVLKLIGTPVKIICKTGDNPYKDKVNILTPRQIKKRQRLMTHVKKSVKR